MYRIIDTIGHNSKLNISPNLLFKYLRNKLRWRFQQDKLLKPYKFSIKHLRIKAELHYYKKVIRQKRKNIETEVHKFVKEKICSNNTWFAFSYHHDLSSSNSYGTRSRNSIPR